MSDERHCKLNCTIDGVPQNECYLCKPEDGAMADQTNLERARRVISETINDPNTFAIERLTAELDAATRDARMEEAKLHDEKLWNMSLDDYREWSEGRIKEEEA